MTEFVGAVLAAGAGTRLGFPKAEATVHGQRLVDRAVETLWRGGCAQVLAVVRSGVAVPHAKIVVNPEPERGMRSSLELAVAAAGNAEALVVSLADMPGISWQTVRDVVSCWQPNRVATAAYADRSGHPIVMSPTMWVQALRGAGPDEGAKAFLRAHPGLISLVPADGDSGDVDTRDDLVRWNESLPVKD